MRFEERTKPARAAWHTETARLLLTTTLAGTLFVAMTALPGSAQSVDEDSVTAETEAGPEEARESEDRTIHLGTVVIYGAGDSSPPYAGGQVATGSRVGVLGNKDILDTPFSTVAYTDEYLANREAQDIGSAIGASDPSVYVPNKRTIYETYYIRGFSTSADDVLFGGLIGMAPNMRGSTEFAERIEVLKGPSTLLYGMPPGGSVAGAVSIIPKRAGDEPLTQLTTTYASDSLWGVHADIGRRFGANKEWGLRFNGVVRDGDTAVKDETHSMKMGSVALDWRGERARFSLDYYRQKEEMEGVNYFGLSLGSAATVIPTPRNGENSLAAPWAFNTNDTETFVLRGEVDLTDSVTAYAAFGRRTGGYDALITSTSLLNDAGDISVSATRQLSDGTQDSGEVGLRGHFSTGSVNHNWTIAATRFESSNKYKTLAFRNHTTTNYYDLDFGAAPDLSAWAGTDYYAQIDQKLTSFVIADTMGFAGDRLQLTLGARYQKVESGQYYLPSMTAASTYEASRVSPAIAAVYKHTDRLSFYGNYVEGLSPGSTAPLTANNPGEVLPPYRTKQIEIGAKWDLGTFTTSLALFQIEKPSAYTDPVTNIYGVYGEQRNRGVELSVFGEARPGLRLLGGVAYTDAKVTKALDSTTEGNTAAGAPAVMAKFGVEYDVPSLEGLTLTGNASYTGKRYVNNANSFSLPSYTTFDLGARYTTEAGGNPLTIRATVQNVTNETYWAGNSLAGGYGAPRTFLLSATMDL
jgi:iron complex outermembrane receptor protein